MSELQLGLIVTGILVVLAVYGFNRYQERQFRRRLEDRFHEQRPRDALLRAGARHGAPDEDRVEPQVGVAPIEEGAQAPGPSKGTDDETALEREPVVAGAPAEAASAPVDVPAIPGGDIDYVCYVDAAEPIAQVALSAFVKSAGMLGKPVLLQGWSSRSHEWLELPCLPEVPLVRIRAALQLADRSGPVNRVQLSTLRDLVHQLTQQVGVSCECPDIDAAAQKALELDRFCAQVDISLGCRLLASAAGGLPGTKLRGLLESAGFVLEPNGRFMLRAEDGVLLMSAENVEAEPLSVERLRAAPIGGLMFTMDVPKVPVRARAFDRMMEISRHLAQALGATVVDDNHAPLTEAGINVIRQQLRVVQEAMDAHGIAAGSPIALRLFS